MSTYFFIAPYLIFLSLVFSCENSKNTKMELSKTSINGSETSGLEGEELALSHFYKAFNTQDIHLMEQS